MNEETTINDEPLKEVTEEIQPVGVQAQVVLKYLEELYGAIHMLSSNLSSQIKSLSEVINEATKESNSND